MSDHDNSAANSSDQVPPDQGAQGDVSTTGHSTHDAAGAGAHGADSHDTGHGGAHGADTSDVSTLVPVGWPQLILPAIILVFVAILVAGPVFSAFAPKPAAAPVEQGGTSSGGVNSGESQATPLQSEAKATSTQAPAATATVAAPTTAATAPAATATTGPAANQIPATQTAVAVAGEQGEVARVPVKLDFAGTSFEVKTGNDLLPDWQPAQGEGTATWIANTVSNQILYVNYSTQNENLFKSTKQGDLIKLTMNTGQVFSFSVSRADRAVNGPATAQGQFTVQTAMAQDHAGVTLFLIGDPAADRAVVQADFNGNIQ